MTFHLSSEPHCLQTWASENDAWRIVVTLTITGSMRVNVWHFAADPLGYCRVYCCGSAVFASIVVNALRKILGELEESTATKRVTDLLPVHTIVDGRERRPIRTDPKLFLHLMELAGVERTAAAAVFDLFRAAEQRHPEEIADGN